MSHNLSIIMPCYNSAATLVEAVSSIYTQGVTIPFEVVMVDDGSTDGTRELIVKLAQIYPNIRYVFHEENRGGGATRNTAIEHTTGDLIFCLDSDNILGPGILPKMVACLDEKDCDGVAINDRRFFRGVNVKKYNSKPINVFSRPISLIDSAILVGDILLDNFLYTKKSYQTTGGYPTNHGYDTQNYELKYLARGQQVYICPGTYYYHRQFDPRKRSYFERVYESGEHSKNMYFIFEDIMYLFDRSVREEIVNFDIFRGNLVGANIQTHLRKLYVLHNGRFLHKNYDKYACPNGWDLFFAEHEKSSSLMDVFCCSIYYYKNKNYDKALECYLTLLKGGLNSNIIYMNIFRVLMGMSGQYNVSSIEVELQHLINSLSLKQNERLYNRSDLEQTVRRSRQLKAIRYRLIPELMSKIFKKPLDASTKRQEQLAKEFKATFSSSALINARQAQNIWNDNSRRLKELVLSNDPMNFLQWDVIQRTMFIGNAKFVEPELKYLKNHFLWDSKWKNAIRESNVGHPKPYWKYPASSGNLIHHAYHLLNFEEKTQLSVQDMNLVLEFGGGYGSMCRLFFNLGFKGKYIIFDLPLFSALQRFYLQSLGINVYNASDASQVKDQSLNGVICVHNLEQLNSILSNLDQTSAMFIATWSLSETPGLEYRQEILSLVNDYTGFLIAYQLRFGEINNLGFFREWREHQKHIKWYSWEVEHLKQNYYLMGKNLDNSPLQIFDD